MNNEDSNLFERAKKICKQIIFNVYAPLLLSESYFPLLFKLLFFLIEFFQILSFFFEPQISYFWFYDDWASKMKTFLDYFMLNSYFALTNYNTYIIFLYLISVFFFWIFLSSIYIGFNFAQNSKKNYSRGFIVGIVKCFNEMLPQVIFFPLFDFFFSFFACMQNGNGEVVNLLFPDVICYQGEYILHAFIAGVAFIIFLLYSMINILCFYEIRNKSVSAKLTGEYELYFLLYKIVVEVAFTFLSSDQNIILLGILSFGCMVLFQVYNRAFIYYDDFIMRVAVAEISLLTWTGMIMVFGKLTFELPFNAYFFVWLVGIIVILVINFTRIRIKYNYLIIETESFNKQEVALEALDNLNFSLNYYKKDKNIAIALDGFIEYHKTYCHAISCPSRKEYSTKSIKNATILDNDNEHMLLLSHLTSNIYFKALQRFPNCIPLRIRYCIFLLDRMGQKQSALQELLTTASYNLKLEEEFLVFRLKYMIEKDIYEENSSNQKLEFNELFLRDLIRSIQENIEKSSNFNMEFWNLLSEDCPNLTKLKEIGCKISSLAKIIERSAKMLQNMNIIIPKIQTLYSKYLLIIMQDKEASERIFEKLQESNLIQQNRILTVYFSEYFHDSSPIIIISADDKSLGYINHVNLSFSSYLGYSRAELINKKVNVLMTGFYSNNHDKFMENYITTLEPRILNREVDFPIKTKSNYIQKTSLLIKIFNTVLQGPQFLGLFKFEKTVKQYSYLICDDIGNISDFSSSSMPMLGIDRKKISKRKLQIQDLIPEFFHNIPALKGKKGMDLNVHVLERDDLKPEEEEKKIYSGNNNVIVMNVYICNEIRFRHTDLLGYFIRLEKKSKTVKEQMPQTKLETNKGKNEVFHLQFDARNTIYLGNISEQEPETNIMEDNFFEDDHVLKTGLAVFNTGVIENSLKESAATIQILGEVDNLKEINLVGKECGLGIRTLRLVKNKLFDIEELKKEEHEDDEEDEENEEPEQSPLKTGKGEPTQEEKEEFEEENGIDKDARYKTLGNFRGFLENNKSRKFDHLKNLKYIALILVITLTILTLVGYFIVKQDLDLRIYDQNYIVISNSRSSEVMSIVNEINQLFLLNKNWISTNYYQEANLRNMLNISIQELGSLQQQVQNSQSNCPSYQGTDISVQFHSSNGSFDIDQVTSQIISKSFNLLTNTTLAQFDENNLDIIFIRENALKDYHMALMALSNGCLIYLQDKLDHTNTLALIFLIIASIVIFFSWGIIVFIIFLGILKFEQDILKMFLCLPLEKVKNLVRKSEQFHSQFKIGDMDQNEDDGSERRLSFEDEEEEEFKVKISKKKRKKFKIETGKYKAVFLYTFVLIFSFEAYFVGTYVLSDSFRNKLSQTLNEFNITVTTFPIYGYYNNIIREVILDPDFTTINEGNITNDFLMGKISGFYDNFYEIQAEHQENSGFYQTYNGIFSSFFPNNVCDQITDNLLNINCSIFSSAILTQGLIVTLPNFFENERYIVSLWNYLTSNSNVSLQDLLNITNIIIAYGNGTLKNNLINIFQLTVVEETNILSENFLKEAYKTLVDEFINDIGAANDSSDLQIVTLLICFLVFLYTAYFLFWLPFMNNLKKENMETANLLVMIPLKLIKNSVLLVQEIEERFK